MLISAVSVVLNIGDTIAIFIRSGNTPLCSDKSNKYLKGPQSSPKQCLITLKRKHSLPHLVSNIKRVQANQLSSASPLKPSENWWSLDDSRKYRSQITHSNATICESLTHRQSPSFSQVRGKVVLEWNHALLSFWLLSLRLLCYLIDTAQKKPTAARILHNVSVSTWTTKTFTQIFSSRIGTFIWWHVNCSARGLHMKRLKRKNNIKKKPALSF